MRFKVAHKKAAPCWRQPACRCACGSRWTSPSTGLPAAGGCQRRGRSPPTSHWNSWCKASCSSSSCIPFSAYYVYVLWLVLTINVALCKPMLLFKTEAGLIYTGPAIAILLHSTVVCPGWNDVIRLNNSLEDPRTSSNILTGSRWDQVTPYIYIIWKLPSLQNQCKRPHKKILRYGEVMLIQSPYIESWEISTWFELWRHLAIDLYRDIQKIYK